MGLGPQEIQVGILKRLRGTTIILDDRVADDLQNAQPPMKILQNR